MRSLAVLPLSDSAQMCQILVWCAAAGGMGSTAMIPHWESIVGGGGQPNIPDITVGPDVSSDFISSYSNDENGLSVTAERLLV